jgi:hypothetical protein
MVRMMALLQQSEQGMIAGKVLADSLPEDKTSFAKSFALLAATSESVRGADVASASLDEKTNEGVAQKVVGQQFVGVKSQAGLVLNAPTKKAEDIFQEAEKGVDGGFGADSVVPSSKLVGLDGSATKQSVSNVKVNQIGTDAEELKDSAVKSDRIAFGKTQIAESSDSSGQIKEDNSAVVDAGEPGTAPVMSEPPVVALSMVKQTVVALRQVRGDEIAVTKEVGSQGMKSDAVIGSKPQRVEPGKAAKSKTAADSCSADAVMTGSTSMAGAADVTVPMAQQPVAASQPPQRSEGEMVALAVGQGKKRDAGVTIDRPDQGRDAKPGVEQSGVGQPGSAVAGEIAVAGRKGLAGEAQVASIDETGKATVVPAGVEGAKVQEIVATDALTVGVKGHVTEHGVGMKQTDAASIEMASGAQDGIAGEATGSTMGGRHGIVAATATTLEVGIPGGTHGWLKIRAEMGSGGEVTAALSSSSSSGQAMLRRELPALSSFLQEERLTVHTVVLDKVATGAGIAGSIQGASSESTGDGRAQQGRSQQGQWNGGDTQGEASRQGKAREWSFVEEPAGYEGRSGTETLQQVMYGTGGSWLSVRA